MILNDFDDKYEQKRKTSLLLGNNKFILIQHDLIL